ncbi:MAG: PEP-CTERM sorting domain-containing protein [Candidatus Solibacter sp.]
MKIKTFTMLAMGIVAVSGMAPRANATVQVTLANGASSVTIIDGGVGDVCGGVGIFDDCVTFSGVLGNYRINVSTGIAQNGTNPFLDLNSVNLTSVSNAGTLTVSTSANGFTAPAPQFHFEVGGTSSLGGSSSFAAYGGNSNGLMDLSHQIGNTLVFPTSPFSNVTNGSGATVGTYSLSIVATLVGVSAGTVSFDAALNAVPEPATMALLGVVLLFSGSAIRRKYRRTA